MLPAGLLGVQPGQMSNRLPVLSDPHHGPYQCLQELMLKCGQPCSVLWPQISCSALLLALQYCLAS